MSKPPPVKGLDIGIPMITPMKGKGFINERSTSSGRKQHAEW